MGTGLETPVCAGAQAVTVLKAASVGLLCDLDSVANVCFPPVLKRCQSLSLAGTKVTPPVGAQASFARTPDDPTGLLAAEWGRHGAFTSCNSEPLSALQFIPTPLLLHSRPTSPRDARACVLFVPSPELPAPAASLALPRTVPGACCLTFGSCSFQHLKW